MTSHPNRSKNPGPRCLNCDNPIKKWARTVWVQKMGGGANQKSDEISRYIQVDTPLRSLAECQQHSNQQVISVSYWPETSSHGRVVNRFSEWDGERYMTVSGFFCSNGCAQNFGRAAAQAGFRRR